MSGSVTNLPPSSPVTASWLWGLPKAELHLHLDTSLRPETALELAPSRGVSITSEEDLIAPEDCPSLVECLKKIDPAIAILQDAESLERCARELAEDICTDGVVYAEIRFAPELHTKKGLTERQVLQAVWKGLGLGQYKSVRTRLIVCALRHFPKENALKAARTAIDNRDLGVIALDLAGDENARPATDFKPAFDLVRAEGLHTICHAGEAAGPESVLSALDKLGAVRIGHGVRAIESPELVTRLKNEGIVLENCPTSNIITKAVASYAAHPVKRFLDAGVKVTINTDARTLIRTTLTDEFTRIARTHSLSRSQVARLLVNAFEGGFEVGPYKEEWVRFIHGAALSS